MRFHPVMSVSLGFIVWFILWVIAVLVGGIAGVVAVLVASGVEGFLIAVSVLFGGFIATYFAKERQIQYGLYEGVCIVLFPILLHGSIGSNITVTSTTLVVVSNIVILFLAGVGGLLGKIIDKNNLKNGFNPIFAIISGYFIAYACNMLLRTVQSMYPPNPIGIISFSVGMITLVIGTFITTFLAKEKKIQYGIYTGIIIIITGMITSSLYHITIYYGLIMVYLIIVVIDSYLTVKLVEHLKLK